jgi:glycosyltransferase involved in cell wall biosynthesis
VDTLAPSQFLKTPISVGVTVDLEFGEHAGGHVKCWQRLAEAAAQHGSGAGCDLTVYFLSDEPATIALGERVRFRLVPARRGTRRLGFGNAPGHTDLASHNPAVEEMLRGHDVLHATAPFALSGSARRVAQRFAKPLAASVHTDNPAFARHYTPEVVRGMFGDTALVRRMMRWLQLPERSARGMARRVRRELAGAQHLFYSNGDQRDAFIHGFPGAARSHLRRGIDRARFHPGLRDRLRLAAALAVPQARPVLAFAGRIDGTKNVDLVAAVSERLWTWGVDHTLLMLGEGALRAPLRHRLGARAVLPGGVAQHDLAWMLASADLFVFPSETETAGNVALEAKACGLPLFVMAGTAPAEAVRHVGEDGIVVTGHDPSAWARAIAPLLAQPARLARHRALARQAGALLPTWRDVLEEDVLPIWRKLAGVRVLRTEGAGVAAEAVR